MEEITSMNNGIFDLSILKNERIKNKDMGKDIIVSYNAIDYFKKKNITSKEWVNFCYKLYNLSKGDQVFYEGNTIGYRRNS